MYNHKYGEFADMQISEIKEILRKRIFFLLLVAEDLETKEKFPEVSHCINLLIVQLSPYLERSHRYNAKHARKVGKIGGFSILICFVTKF